MDWLKNSSKKILKGIAIIVAGTFILSGVALAGGKQDRQFRGEPGDNKRPGYHQRNIDPVKVAQVVSKTFGINQEKVAAYQAQGYDARDLFRAGLFARTAGKTYDEVITLKNKDNSWQEVADKLNITREQLRATRQDMFAEHAAQMLKTDKSVIKSLTEQGYKPHDIIPAGILANRAGKSIGDVLSLKKINNTWQEIAASLGVNEEDFRNDMRTMFKEAGMDMPLQKRPANRHNF